MASAKPTPIAAVRRRLVLEAPAGTPDEAGGMTQTFQPVATLWAEIRWLGGDERWQAGRPEQAARHAVTIRWREGLDAGMRFSGAGRLYGIVSVGDPSGDRRRLTCLCEEISP